MQGRSVGKGHGPEPRPPGAQERLFSGHLGPAEVQRGWAGAWQKGLEDPATEPELAQAAGQKQV